MAGEMYSRLLSIGAVVLLAIFLQLCDCNETPRIKSLTACTDIKYRFATTRISSHVINPSNQSRQAVFDITLPNDAFISNFTLTVGGTTYTGRVEERGEALKLYGANATDGEFSSGKVSQRRRETNLFRVTLKVAPQQEVSFNLTYQEILERRLGFYDHVLYIDPGQPVEDMRIDVSIEENREITYLHVPPIRSDMLTNDFDISETNSLVRVERPSGRHAYISYSPSVQQQQQQGMSRDGLSGLFTVRYDVGRSLDAGELLSVNGYFVHFIAPPVQEVVPKDVLFILDTSTSMMWRKLGQLQDAMRVILSDLAPGDRFALMQFNSRATFWRRELLPVNNRTIDEALRYVDSLKAGGFTNIDSALEQGLDFFNEEPTVKGNNSLIIFLTDGRSTRGETDRKKILSHVREKNAKNVTVYGLAFGKDADWPLVKKMAAQNEGVGQRIYQDADAALQIQGFYSEVSTLLLTGVQARYVDSEVDVATLTNTLFAKFFNGSEMVVAGKLIQLNQTALEVVVQATGLKGKVNLTIVPDPDFDPVTPMEVKSCGLLRAEDLDSVVEKMWAYLTIRQLLQQRVGENDPQRKRELRDRATELALRYNFVTPVTSLVVTKPGSDELAFLQEDASDLVDELDPVIAEEGNTTTTATTTVSGTPTLTQKLSSTSPQPEDSSREPEHSTQEPSKTSTKPTDTTTAKPSAGRGGGGGDPHFMVEMTSLAYPLCFDVTGDTGDVFRLLRDPETGLTVNVEVEKGLWRSPGSSRDPVYITRAAILLQDIVAEVTSAHVKVNDVILRWGTSDSAYLPGVWLMMRGASLRFALDWGAEVDVSRHVRRVRPQDRGQRTEAFLNVEIQNEAGLSRRSSGLLGQFVHKEVRLQRLKKRHGRLVGELEIKDERGGHSYVRHGRALLKNRKDAYFGRQAACLMVDAAWSHTLDKPTRLYKVRSLYDI